MEMQPVGGKIDSLVLEFWQGVTVLVWSKAKVGLNSLCKRNGNWKWGLWSLQLEDVEFRKWTGREGGGREAGVTLVHGEGEPVRISQGWEWLTDP